MNARFRAALSASIALLFVVTPNNCATANADVGGTGPAAAMQVQSTAPVLAGSVYKLAAGDSRSVPVAGASVYLHPADSQDDNAWIGPNLTDAYGRFTFQGPSKGQYLMRIFSGSMRLWEQTVQLPTKLEPVVIRDVRVVYYPKSTDGATVLGVLEKLAFPFDKADSVNAIPTNTLWFGDRVAVGDVKTIAGALLRGGVNLRAIRRFHTGSDWKAKLVEIGASPKRIAGTILDPKQIAASNDFPRD